MAEETSLLDRVRVHRVRIHSPRGPQEIPSCWISIPPARPVVQIWMAPEQPAPDRVVPLLDVVIDWGAPGVEH